MSSQTHRDVSVDALRPAVHVDHPEQGGQLAAEHLLRFRELGGLGAP